MKTHAFIFLVSFLLYWPSTISATARIGLNPPSPDSCKSDFQPTSGDFTPFPWGSEVHLSKNNLDGIWAPSSNQCGTYFSFKTRSNNDLNQRLVNIIQFNPYTCEILATGIGYELDRVFHAAMISNNLDQSKFQSFDLTLRAFNPKDIKYLPPINYDNPSPRLKPLVVMTMYPRQSWESQAHYPLGQIAKRTSYYCSNGYAITHSP